MGYVSFTEFIEAMQVLKESVSAQDWSSFFAALVAVKPIDCSQFRTCTSCAAIENGGICGWDSNPERTTASVDQAYSPYNVCVYIDDVSDGLDGLIASERYCDFSSSLGM